MQRKTFEKYVSGFKRLEMVKKFRRKRKRKRKQEFSFTIKMERKMERL
jgi:hypothetical protein